MNNLPGFKEKFPSKNENEDMLLYEKCFVCGTNLKTGGYGVIENCMFIPLCLYCVKQKIISDHKKKS